MTACRTFLTVLALTAAAWWGTAEAQRLGDPVERFADAVAMGAADDDGWYATDTEARLLPRERDGLLWRLGVRAPLAGEAVDSAAHALAVAAGAPRALRGPIAQFLREQAPRLAGGGPASVAVETYRLTLEVTAGEPAVVEAELSLPNRPASAFPEPAATLGPADAAHVVREFSDFQCPFCARFQAEVLPRLKETLLARGDVRFEYHHMPLESLHPNAAVAAEAAECVAEDAGEDAFWTYHDLLFARQGAWSDQSDPFAYLARLAREAGAERQAVADCLEEGRFASQVAEAVRAGEALGVRGTPSVYVDGFQVADYRDLDAFERLMDLSERFPVDDGGGAG